MSNREKKILFKQLFIEAQLSEMSSKKKNVKLEKEDNE